MLAHTLFTPDSILNLACQLTAGGVDIIATGTARDGHYTFIPQILTETLDHLIG